MTFEKIKIWDFYVLGQACAKIRQAKTLGLIVAMFSNWGQSVLKVIQILFLSISMRDGFAAPSYADVTLMLRPSRGCSLYFLYFNQ